MGKNGITDQEELLTWSMLYDDDDSTEFVGRYDPTYHPNDILQYFRERYVAVEDPERYATEHKLSHVMKPVRPPSMAGYAAREGITKETLWKWRKKFGAFDRAAKICQAMQEDMIISLTACGAYNPAFAGLMMKNLHAWVEKVEADVNASVTLKFDLQDEEA